MKRGLLLLALLALSGVEASAPARAQEEPDRHAGPAESMLEGWLRDGYIQYFSKDPTNEIALQTAAFFRDTEAPISLRRLPSNVLAEYSAREGRVIVNLVPLGEKYTHFPPDSWTENMMRHSIMESWRTSPELLRSFAERTSAVVVHEVGHAIYGRAVGTEWNSVEQEMAVRAREMLFLLAQLRQDPGFLKLDAYDGVMRRLLIAPPKGVRNAALEPEARAGVMYPATRAPDDPPANPGVRPEKRRWWRDPLPPGVTGQQIDDADVEVRQRFPGDFDRFSMTWFQLHTVSNGIQDYWDYLASVLPNHYKSVDQDWDKNAKKQQADLRKLERQVRTADAESRPGLRTMARELRDEIAQDRAFHGNRDLERAYRVYFVAEKKRLTGQLTDELREWDRPEDPEEPEAGNPEPGPVSEER